MSDACDFIIENGILKEYVGDSEVVIVPEEVVRIGDRAFSDREDITDVELPDGVTSIGNDAFYGCASLSGINMPEGLTCIGNNAFWGCESLEATIPDHVTNIGCGAFCGCDALADDDGFVIIRGVMYYYCGEKRHVTVPNGVTRIDEQAFFTGEDIESVVLPDGLISIGGCAFANCYELAHIVIPGSVTNTAPSAFDDCQELTIHAPAGSYAIGYAKSNDISFVAEG